MSPGEEWDATTPAAFWADLDAAQRRHPSGVGEDELVFSERDEMQFRDLFTSASELHRPLPSGWQSCAEDEAEPLPNPIPDRVAVWLLLGLGILLPVLIIVAAIHWTVS
jgi:hypothetical protein